MVASRFENSGGAVAGMRLWTMSRMSSCIPNMTPTPTHSHFSLSFIGTPSSSSSLICGLDVWTWASEPSHGPHHLVSTTAATALETCRLKVQLAQVSHSNTSRFSLENIVGRSKAIRDMLEMIQRLAQAGATTLLV